MYILYKLSTSGYKFVRVVTVLSVISIPPEIKYFALLPFYNSFSHFSSLHRPGLVIINVVFSYYILINKYRKAYIHPLHLNDQIYSYPGIYKLYNDDINIVYIYLTGD